MFNKNSPFIRTIVSISTFIFIIFVQNKAIVMNRDFIRRTYRKYMKYGFKLEYGPSDDCIGESETKFYSHTLTMFGKPIGGMADNRIELKPLGKN